MPIHGAAMSLMLKKGYDRRKEDELWKAFTEADKNKDGYLSMEEYVGVFQDHGIAITQDEVMMFFNSKDRDRDGRISYEEFCDKETVNERAFKAMDINNDGFVSKAEMLKASNRSTRRLSADDIEACFREFDKDRDKKLSYEEFCDMMNTRRHTLEVLLEHHISPEDPASTSKSDEDAGSTSTQDTSVE
eukprot:maker-scaffold144_size312663-snap-gene-0.7 protein:Tk07265 transcript:maker-scaffold144_size312663-snap-gene-0.7-mRNA-1 annotation:"Calmodulin"